MRALRDGRSRGRRRRGGPRGGGHVLLNEHGVSLIQGFCFCWAHRRGVPRLPHDVRHEEIPSLVRKRSIELPVCIAVETP
jgi:hypothetical protein